MMGMPVVVVDSGGIPVTVATFGTPMTVGANEMGTAVTIVDAGGLPVVLLNDDGTAYEPS
jgi:hypothetical protein